MDKSNWLAPYVEKGKTDANLKKQTQEKLRSEKEELKKQKNLRIKNIKPFFEKFRDEIIVPLSKGLEAYGIKSDTSFDYNFVKMRVWLKTDKRYREVRRDGFLDYWQSAYQLKWIISGGFNHNIIQVTITKAREGSGNDFNLEVWDVINNKYSFPSSIEQLKKKIGQIIEHFFSSRY